MRRLAEGWERERRLADVDVNGDADATRPPAAQRAVASGAPAAGTDIVRGAWAAGR
ncbi:Uncharacterised protein [Mycobacteroides abscessus subsp. abscessus]|nr:Uncharacterised protein [Mycobacteroides abscessus subsp. abscessus]